MSIGDSGLDVRLNQEIGEVYDWLCVEAAPDVRSRLHQSFTLDAALPTEAIVEMVRRGWLHREGNGQVTVTAKGLSELSRRRPDLRGT